MKKFCDKLIELRREKGFSQEQLAEYLEVSRQSVSKWEADKTMPEISKLIVISELFQVSLDYLLIDDCENRDGRTQGMEVGPDRGAGRGLGDSDIWWREEIRQQESGQQNSRRQNIRQQSGGQQNSSQQSGGQQNNGQPEDWQKETGAGWPGTSLQEAEEMKESLNEIREFIGCRKGFEYKSRASVFGIPLVHVKFGGGNGKVRLRDAARGIIAVGNLAFGVVSVGIFSAGLLSFGVLSLGLLFSLGVVSLGAIAVGVVAMGIVTGGISSVGIYATGVAAAGKEVATGVSVSGKTAAGMQGARISGWNLTVTDNLTTKEAMKDFILTYNPGLPGWLVNFLTLIYK
ncbi:helix-turn-helix domain-containing protein [Eisenbergiella sp.]